MAVFKISSDKSLASLRTRCSWGVKAVICGFLLGSVLVLSHKKSLQTVVYEVTREVEFQPPRPTCNDDVCSQEQRFQTLRRVCKKYPHLSENFQPDNNSTYWRLLVDDRHKILYCAMPKAASTTFYNLFYFAATGIHLNKTKVHCQDCWEKEGLIWLSKFSKEERDRRLREYLKIMVVRHPLDRAASCWNDKFIRPYHHITWNENGPKIVEMFRDIPKNSTLEKEIKKGVRFPEFVQYVNHLEDYHLFHDEHWNTHYRLCHPCSIDYDRIIKVETLSRDSEFVVNKLGLNASDFPFVHSKRTDNDKTLKLQKTVKEFRDLDSSQFSKLKQMYRWDMELYDYHWNDKYLEASCEKRCDGKNKACC